MFFIPMATLFTSWQRIPDRKSISNQLGQAQTKRERRKYPQAKYPETQPKSQLVRING
jgi:hypothetical protein